jgi:diguanylate cyclase (GGDEF)-like protein
MSIKRGNMIGNHATLINRLRFLIADWVLRDAKAFYLRNPLTQLPTRNALEAAACRRDFFALFLDLDNLKDINLHRGYQAGDRAILDVANCITQHVRKRDLVSHWGGDEFAILLYESSIEDVTKIAQRMLGQINVLGYSASIGVGDSIETAQINQQTAKAQGKNQLSIFNKRQSIQYQAHPLPKQFPSSYQLEIGP